MKRILVLFALLTLSLSALAQEAKREPNLNKELKTRVFELQHREPADLYRSLQLLGSGFPGSDMAINDQLHTVTVRDYPENIAAIDDAIKRLDKPAVASTNVELTVWVLIASKSSAAHATALPDELIPVVKELQSTLRYSSYALLSANVNNARAGRRMESVGIAEAGALGDTPQDPLRFSYSLAGLTTTVGARPSLSVDDFHFSMRVPTSVRGAVQVQDVGFETPLTVRDGEKVVVGTTTLGDRALIVVVTAKFAK